MGDRYRAATRIKYAVNEDGSPEYEARKVVDTKFFEPGDVVEGLSKEDMAALWENRSLYTDGDTAEHERVTGETPDTEGPTNQGPEGPSSASQVDAADPEGQKAKDTTKTKGSAK
jgi:hypothetical protein